MTFQVPKSKGRVFDLQGKRFGRLRVLNRSSKHMAAGATWDCLCACGEQVVALSCKLTSGRHWACHNGLCRLGAWVGKREKFPAAPPCMTVKLTLTAELAAQVRSLLPKGTRGREQLRREQRIIEQAIEIGLAKVRAEVSAS